jgi:O-antigen/teichoic acid export membrane protein
VNHRSTRRGQRGVPANAGLAFAGDAASKVAAFAIVVLCARLLPLDEFAHLGVALAALTVLTCLVDAGVATVIVRDCAARTDRARAVMRASIPPRAPLVALTAAAGIAGGLVVGDLWLGVATAVAAVAAAWSLSLTALFRAVQDFAPEAIQKCCVAGVTLAAAAVLAASTERASIVVGALATALAASLAPLWIFVRRLRTSHERVPGREVMRAALPFGLMALATLLYYRLGTLVLGATGSASATASYTIASTLAFGLLMVPNAITSGLLPRLGAQEVEKEQLETARSALRWTIAVCGLMSVLFASVAPYVLRYGFAPRYEDALVPLLLLLAGTVVIGINGVLGTVLIVRRRTSIVSLQVGASLAVNAALAVALVPRFGANGAAVSTLVTELVALAILAAAALRFAPGLLMRPFAPRRSLIARVGADAHNEAGL